MTQLSSRLRAFLPMLLLATISQASAVDAARPQHRLPGGVKCPGSVTAPMIRWDGRRPAVHVRVNGKGPYLFLIDTGAGGQPARADARLADTLQLIRSGTVEKNDGSAAARAAGATMPEYLLDSVSFGGLTRRSVRAPSRDYKAGIDGILGYRFFAGCLLTLDYAKGEVRVRSGALSPGRRTIKYTSDEGGPQIPIRIGQVDAIANLDTGDSEGFDLPGALSEKLRFKDVPRVIGTGHSANNSYEVREARFAGKIAVGAIEWMDPVVTFADVFDNINIGSRALQEMVITFDQDRKLIRFTKRR
jgi:hypothetical protein